MRGLRPIARYIRNCLFCQKEGYVVVKIPDAPFWASFPPEYTSCPSSVSIHPAPGHLTSPIPNISITTRDIDGTKQIKYLGVSIDNYLKWGPHIQRIKNKLTMNNGILNTLRFYISVGTLRSQVKVHF